MINEEIKCLKFHNRHVFFTKNDVDTIFGMKKGKIDVGKMLRKESIDEEFKWELGVKNYKYSFAKVLVQHKYSLNYDSQFLIALAFYRNNFWRK